jgi:hypothetical protein|tara:strand:- start:163 stop:327 length:165 start_codon:yes stop_codon:yes gene_type:complete
MLAEKVASITGVGAGVWAGAVVGWGVAAARRQAMDSGETITTAGRMKHIIMGHR